MTGKSLLCSLIVTVLLSVCQSLRAETLMLFASSDVNAGHGTHDETFLDKPLAVAGTSVTIQSAIRADLAGSTRYLDLRMGNATGTSSLITRWFQYDGLLSCYSPYTPNYGSYIMSAADFNNLLAGGTPGTVYVMAQYSASVRRYCDACPFCDCSGAMACVYPQTIITITYNAVEPECTTPGDCQGNPGPCRAWECNAGECSTVITPGANCGSGPTDCSNQDTCNSSGSCQVNHKPNGTSCDDGFYCNGTDTCSGGTCSQHTGNPCDLLTCDEPSDSCVCTGDEDCDDGVYCNGAETCDSNGLCQDGSYPCPDQECREADDLCVDCLYDTDCDDGAECTGLETCNTNGLCQPGTEPCQGQFCCEDGQGGLCASVCCDDAHCLPGETCDVSADTCDPDCNSNDIPDDQDIAVGTSGDCNSNSIPDECDPDCNTNGIADECEINEPGAGFDEIDSWAAHDAGVRGDGNGLDGYAGGTYDGRYIYLAPYRNGGGRHNAVVRYDTTLDFNQSNSWESFAHPHAASGFLGAVSDGRYVYFVPYYDDFWGHHGRVLRYDTQAAFSENDSWGTFIASDLHADAKGFEGAVFDGQYIYLVPHHHDTSYHRRVVRYDTTSDDYSNTSGFAWGAYSPTGVHVDALGYSGGTFDGQYVYFAPYRNNSAYHGHVLRYDTLGTNGFENESSWQDFDPDPSGLDDLDGYHGTVFDGRYVYFVPRDNVTGYHGKVLRYDTDAPFVNTNSWTHFDASALGPDLVGFQGGTFDGRFVYFAPYHDADEWVGRILRFDTTMDFSSPSSWSTFDPGVTWDGPAFSYADGYRGAIFDGRHVYFVPSDNNQEWHGEVLRYDTQAGWLPDCNTNNIPDSCDLMDYNADGAVDLLDFSWFQICFETTDASCLAAFDVVGECGLIDLTEYALLESQLTGPLAGEMMMGGGGSAPLAGGSEPGDDPAPPAEEVDPWTYAEADVVLDVRMVGGGPVSNRSGDGDAGEPASGPVMMLAPNTTYELHYQAEHDQVNMSLLFAVAVSQSTGFTGAAAPASGDWVAARSFEFFDFQAEYGAPVETVGFPGGFMYQQMIYSDFQPEGDIWAGSAAHLCNFTTGSPGVLYLELHLNWHDPVGREFVDMHTTGRFIVASQAPATDDAP